MGRALLLAALLLGDVSPRGHLFRAENARAVGSFQLGKSPAGTFAFTRDSRRIVVLTLDGKMSTWDLTARRELRQMPGGYFFSRIQLSGDGSRAIMPNPDRRSVRIIDIDKGEEIKSFSDVHATYLQAYSLSPDGRRAVVIKRDQTPQIISLDDKEPVSLSELAAGQAGSMAWSPDGKTLAIHGWDSTLRFIDAATGKVGATVADMGRIPMYLGFSPNSSTLALVTQEARIRLFDRKGREVATLDDILTGSRVLAFSPDSALMAGADIFGKVRIWDAKTWRRLRDIDAGSIRHLAFSPDGRHLALMTYDGTVKLWGGTGPAIGAAKPAAPRGGVPAFLGISGDTSEGEEAGVLISMIIAGTAAERAGLKAGDRIIRIGASATESFDALRTVVMSLREGDEVEVVYRRDGAEKKVKVTLGSRPADE